MSEHSLLLLWSTENSIQTTKRILHQLITHNLENFTNHITDKIEIKHTLRKQITNHNKQ